jgi:peptide subunit release factor 1 (eRF1)
LRRPSRSERLLERESEERLVEQLVGEARARRRATYDLAPTLDALWLGDVRTLVLSHGVRAAGSECPSCCRLEPGTATACLACGTPMTPVHDVFDWAAERAVRLAGTVEVVHGDAASVKTGFEDAISATVVDSGSFLWATTRVTMSRSPARR